MCGYNGPIYMTVYFGILSNLEYPTKAICPILLDDYRKITVERKGEINFFTSQMIKNCMKKVMPVNLHQTVWVDDELEIKPYYAGHVQLILPLILGTWCCYVLCESKWSRICSLYWRL